MKKLIILSIAVVTLTGCSLGEIEEVQSARQSINDAKDKATQIKNDAEQKVEQAQNLKKEFDEFTDAWDEFNGNSGE